MAVERKVGFSFNSVDWNWMTSRWISLIQILPPPPPMSQREECACGKDIQVVGLVQALALECLSHTVPKFEGPG